MALVKMYRDEPEVPGGNTEAMIPEEGVNAAMDNGWKLKGKVDEKKPEPAKVEEPKVEEPKVEEPKVEPVKEEKSDFPEFEKNEGKKGKK